MSGPCPGVVLWGARGITVGGNESTAGIVVPPKGTKKYETIRNVLFVTVIHTMDRNVLKVLICPLGGQAALGGIQTDRNYLRVFYSKFSVSNHQWRQSIYLCVELAIMGHSRHVPKSSPRQSRCRSMAIDSQLSATCAMGDITRVVRDGLGGNLVTHMMGRSVS